MTRWFCLLAAVALAAGCKGEKKPERGETAAASAIAKKEDLLARRDALLSSRQTIEDEQAKLEAERVALVQSGGDTTEIDKRKEELATEARKLAGEERALFDSLERQLSEVSAMAAAGADQNARVAGREAAMASREKSVASREERVAAREAALALRERQQATRERELCGGGAAPTTIIQTVDAKGSRYNKRDVEPVLRRARESMAKKGILPIDLPANVQELEREATKAMADGNYGAAFLAAKTLNATVDSMKIDRSFITAKIGRLSARMKGVKLDEDKQKQVDQLFTDATARYGDGDFAGANRKLNQIYAAIP